MHGSDAELAKSLSLLWRRASVAANDGRETKSCQMEKQISTISSAVLIP
jgi:hypothetical protein